MSIVFFGRRASAVLYRYLCETRNDGYWILPANICPIVPAVFQKANRQYRIFDIDAETLCLKESAVLNTVKNETCLAGVFWSRSYGSTLSVERIFEKIKAVNKSIRIVDDKCLCRPDFDHSGGVADLELYSSGYSKYIDFGWGGWGFLKKKTSFPSQEYTYREFDYMDIEEIFKKCKEKQVAFTCPATHWLDLREPEIPWSTFQAQLKEKLDAITNHRITLRKIYEERLNKWALSPNLQHWRFNIIIEQQNELMTAIFACGHFASAHYKSIAPVFGRGDTPVADDSGRRIVNFFIDQHYTAQRAAELAVFVESFLTSKL